MLPLFLFFGFTRNTVYLAQITGILSSCLQQQVPKLSTAHILHTHSTRWRPEGSVAALYAMKWKNTTFTLTAASRKRPRDTALRFLKGKGRDRVLMQLLPGLYTSQHARRQKGTSKTFLADLNVQR